MRLAPEATFKQALEPGDNAFVLVLEGTAKVGASATPVSAGELAWLSRDDEALGSDVTIATDEGACRALLFSGRPLNEPIAFGGPFVMNTDAEIQQAFVDYRAGRF
jgi:redox-sensitive bicupin YhaK (pirin superfamily)